MFRRKDTPQMPEDSNPSTVIPSRDDLNPIERAERGERVVVSLPESEQPHPIYGFDRPPTAEPSKE